MITTILSSQGRELRKVVTDHPLTAAEIAWQTRNLCQLHPDISADSIRADTGKRQSDIGGNNAK